MQMASQLGAFRIVSWSVTALMLWMTASPHNVRCCIQVFILTFYGKICDQNYYKEKQIEIHIYAIVKYIHKYNSTKSQSLKILNLLGIPLIVLSCIMELGCGNAISRDFIRCWATAHNNNSL